ncbi:MAG: hypothetical protein K9H62_23045 [Bacteroidales bacterium]|nr:hypothetical protein [Bacteroidales bacterium]
MGQFTGLGAGTIGDPHQITTVEQFRQMSYYATDAPVLVGAGDVQFTVRGYNQAVANDYRVNLIVYGTPSGMDYDWQHVGFGYEVGDTFSVNGGIDGYLTTGTVATINGSGGITSATILVAGKGYYTGSVGIPVTTLTGNGSGAYIKLTGIVNNKFTWSKDGGADSAEITINVGSNTYMTDGILIKWSTNSDINIGNYWTIHADPVGYFKLMNDLDFGGTSTSASSISIGNYYSHLDGDGYELQGVAVYTSGKGFAIKSGCSISDLTVRITNRVGVVVSDYNNFLFLGGGSETLDNTVISGLHIIISCDAIMGHFSNHTWNATCTLENIVLEGNLQEVFSGVAVKCLVESLKVLRTGNTLWAGGGLTRVPLVKSLEGELRYCQHILLGMDITAGSSGLFASSMSNTALITEFLAIGYLNVDYSSLPTTQASHAMVGQSTATAGTSSEIKDCLIKGASRKCVVGVSRCKPRHTLLLKSTLTAM